MSDNNDLFVLGHTVPEVEECYGTGRDVPHRIYGPDGTWTGGYHDFCDQCRGDHRHEWVSVKVQHHPSGEVMASRCHVCGGRKCDLDCIERRHHRGPHQSPEGVFTPVG